MTTPDSITNTGRGWVPDLDGFGTRLAVVRQKQGWNIARAARECGLDGESWRLWEQGREPSRRIEIARAIAARTGVDYLWLVHGPVIDTPPQPDTRPIARYVPLDGLDLDRPPVLTRLPIPIQRDPTQAQPTARALERATDNAMAYRGV